MNLDPRINKLSDILTRVNVDEARKLIGQKGYFADHTTVFDNLNDKLCSVLTDIDSDSDLPFISDNRNIRWRYFLPENRLKPVEKKYRAYTFKEFTDIFTIGRPIKFRKKGKVGYERYLTLNGYQHEPGLTTIFIHIGAHTYTLDELFNAYEWQEHYTEDFKPFGVED